MNVLISLIVIVAIIVASLYFFYKNRSPISKPVTSTGRVIIIGGGLCGLVLAYKLTKSGIPFTLLESKPYLGGRIATIKYPNGIKSEAPLEEYWQRSPAINLLKELNVEMHESPAHSSVMIGGKIYTSDGDPDFDKYCQSMKFTESEKKSFADWNKYVRELYETFIKDEDIFNINPLTKVGMSDVKKQKYRELMSISFEQFIKNCKLPHKVEEWIRITLEPEIATQWNEISALDGIDEMEIFINSAEGFGQSNYHLEGGNTQFIKALLRHINIDNIKLNCTVTGITSIKADIADGHHCGLEQVTYLQSTPFDDKKYSSIYGQIVVITVPLSEINHIKFYPMLDAERKIAMETLRFGTYIKVHLQMSNMAKSLWQNKYGENLFTLLTDDMVGSIYDASPSDSSKIVNLTILFHGKYAQDLIQLTDSEIEHIVTSRLNSLFPSITDHLLEVEIFTFPKAVAYWPNKLGRSRFDYLSHKLRQPFGYHNNLYIGGDTTYSSHSEGAVLSALKINDNIVKYFNNIL